MTQVVREADGPDLEKLADKLEGFAVGPLKDGGRVAVYSLEHTAEMFRRRLKNRRMRWMGMRSDSTTYDDAFRRVVGGYLDACEELVQAFDSATSELRKGEASLRDGKASMKQVKRPSSPGRKRKRPSLKNWRKSQARNLAKPPKAVLRGQVPVQVFSRSRGIPIAVQ